MTGKTLAELRIEIELGLKVYPLPDGYCCVFKDSRDGMYVYASYNDQIWPSFDEMVKGLGEDGEKSIWTTVDVYPDRPHIEIPLSAPFAR